MTHAELIKKHPKFIYHSYEIKEEADDLVLSFHFEIENLGDFKPSSRLPLKYITNSKINPKFLNNLVFHFGLVEMLSYYKITASEFIEIKAGYLDEEQLKFFKKLLQQGLGEFFYTNKIEVSKDYPKFIINHKKEKILFQKLDTDGNLILVGGGKDSCVSLELLKDYSNDVLIHNGKEESIEIAKIAQIKEEKIIVFQRTLDRKMLKLNQEGYLNGHTPLSALLAFESYLIAYLRNKKYIVLSNEASANEATVLGTDVNHQYSKSFEFEKDFVDYTNKYFSKDIKYFSLLRSISEYQISLLFANYKHYHPVFKSCNVGSKQTPWIWCCNCSKCLFVYLMLYNFLPKEEMLKIFGEDLLEKESLLEIFKEIIGVTGIKPFDCVGSVSEVRYAISKAIKKTDDLPYLLRYYQDNYDLELSFSYEKYYNKTHLIETEFENLVKEELAKYV